jgi:hypothetical protein
VFSQKKPVITSLMSYMPTVSQSIRLFLTARKASLPGGDLVESYLRHAPNLETQVNVSAGDGDPVAQKRNTWTNGIYEWHAVRIPKNANDVPEFHDYEIRFPLDLHAEAIGSTGWDWANLRSRWVGFDFDSITGHAKGVGITGEELSKVREAASAIPWVEVRNSTGGSGLHLYVHFGEDGVYTANHTEHAALARAVLGMMSSESGFDFASQIDVCGGNMWIWHTKITTENQGLKLLKPAERPLTTDDLPSNWRDHIEVVTRRRSKIRLQSVPDEALDPFQALVSSRRIVPLDERHKRTIDDLADLGYSTIWVSDHHLLQTHTRALQTLLEDRKAIGLFQTVSEGRNPGQPNCFAFPLENGAWRVYRFSPGIPEAETWTQDGEGWTTCYFNRLPDLNTAARATGGSEMSDGKGYQFSEARDAIAAAKHLGQSVHLPDEFLDREAVLKRNKDGRLVVQVKQKKSEDGGKEPKPVTGWADKKGGWWERVYDTKTDLKKEDLALPEYDKAIRALTSPSGDRAGWATCHCDGDWDKVPKDDARSVLLRLGLSRTEADQILGDAIHHRWKLVNLPFQDEYPGGRQWNLNAAQFRFLPCELKDDEIPVHPHWDAIFNHVGKSLDNPIKELQWCRDANIQTGGDYLRLWIACCLREPFQPLPYLFLFGPENSGKSILHEAIGLLITKGKVIADRALTNQSDFNGELAGAILCVVEEKDISRSSGAYNKIKEWVTGREISIRKMRTESYQQPNTTHWIQCANRAENCPVFPGDTRITVMFVPALPKDAEIPKQFLLAKLEEEAPHLMRTLLDLTLPTVIGRLRLPVVTTDDKLRSEDLNRSPLEQFIQETCFEVPGEKIPFADFYTKFITYLPEDERYEWTKIKVTRGLPKEFACGAGASNVKFIGNLSWEPSQHPPGTLQQPYIVVGGKLRLKEGF